MKKGLKMFLGISAIVGGAVHVLTPLGFNILGLFQSFAPFVQVLVGALTVWFSIAVLNKKK